MRNPTLAPVLTAIFFALAAASATSAAPRVEMELITEAGFPLTGAHAWMAALQELGAENLRVRSARGGERAEIKVIGSGDAAVYQVTGVLTRGNQLMLPTGSFSLQEKGRIAEWLAKVKAGGVEELTAPRTLFGLTAREFSELHDRLAAPVAFSTKGQSAYECVKSLVRGLGVSVSLDGGARAAFQTDWTVSEELQGVSQGTALAALLRPFGLAFAPKRKLGGHVSLAIDSAATLEESWPVGWPLETNPREALPDLLTFLQVEIVDTPLTDALAAIQGRLKVPFLYDRATMARDRIEPAEVNVSLPAKRTYYKKMLDQLLFQAKLKCDIRKDEAGASFLWITSVKP